MLSQIAWLGVSTSIPRFLLSPTLALLLSGMKVCRTLSIVFHSLTAASSAAWYASVPFSWLFSMTPKEFAATSAFWSRMRRFRMESNARRWVRTATPFSASALAACDMAATMLFCPSVAIFRS